MSFEKDVKKIDSRDWDKMRGLWLADIPELAYAGQVPSHELGEVIDISTLYNKTKGFNGEYREEIERVRPEILREGVFFAHKAVHVCGSAIVHLENGILSWGISSAYHASFFSLKSIICLLGISFPRINYKCVMIDCFPEEVQLSKNKIKKGVVPPKELKFCIFSELTHVQYWEIFQRILRVSKIDILQQELRTVLMGLDSQRFVSQRNKLHYTSNYWTVQRDLYERVFDNTFASWTDPIGQIVGIGDTSANDFTFLICYLLIKFNVDLIKSLGELSGAINNEYLLIKKTLGEGIHGRLLSSVNLD